MRCQITEIRLVRIKRKKKKRPQGLGKCGELRTSVQCGGKAIWYRPCSAFCIYVHNLRPGNSMLENKSQLYKGSLYRCAQ